MELLEDKSCKRCKKPFTPKVEWQKFCSPECHDQHWKDVYRDRSAVNKRLDKVEKKLGIK